MIHHFANSQAVVNVSIEHLSNKVDALFRERQVRDPKGMVQNLVNIVERVFLVDDRVEKDSQGPDILLLAPVRLTLQNLGCSIV